MGKTFEIPLILDLEILQQEQYWPVRYVKRKLVGFFNFSKQKVELSETYKAKAYMAMYVLGLAFVYFLTVKTLPLGVAAGVFILLNIWPVFILFPVGVFVKQLERWILTLVAIKKSVKLKENKKIEIVGMAGSYGKSAVKETLFEILSGKGKTIKTGPGRNTLMDIIRTVDGQEKKNVRYFLVEMGAFAKGDIKQMTKLVKTDWAMIINIGSDNIERLGSIKNIFKANFELVDRMEDKKRVLVNWDDEEIKKQIEGVEKYKEVMKMSFEDPLAGRADKKADFWINKAKMGKTKSCFWIKHKTRNYKFETKLFGRVNLENVAMAVCMGLMMGIPAKKIAKTIAKIEAKDGYLKLIKTREGIVVDDTRANNKLAFEKMIGDMKEADGKKVLVTPGILGIKKETKSVHQLLGKKAGDIFDEVVLVKESEMTRSMQVGVGRSKTKTKLWFLEDESKYQKTISKLAHKYDWVVMEGDI